MFFVGRDTYRACNKKFKLKAITHSKYGDLFTEPYVSVNDALGWKEVKTLSHNRCRSGKSENYYLSTQPARTITTRGHALVSPPPYRMLTWKEEAKLQSFPDWFKFSGGITSKRKQIGNAVPPLLVQRIAESWRDE